MTFLVSWALSRTLLKGEVSAFSLELPPNRPPRVLSTIYRSLIDRTIFVLWRAMVFAAPAGMVIWFVANLHVGDSTVAEILIGWFSPFGLLIGLNGVILLAYLVAIPANDYLGWHEACHFRYSDNKSTCYDKCYRKRRTDI